MPDRRHRRPAAGRVSAAPGGVAVLMTDRTSAASSGAPAKSAQLRGSGISGVQAAQMLNRITARHMPKHGRALQTVDFILNWLPNVEFAGLWVAAQKGWFAQSGIHLMFK